MQVLSYLQFVLRYFMKVGWNEENNAKKKPSLKYHKKHNMGNNLCMHKYIKFKDREKKEFLEVWHV